MTSGFHADTGLVAQTSQNAASHLDTVISQFQKMNSDTETVLQICQGSMFSAATDALAGLQQQRNKLIPRMQLISEQLKQGGQGMDSQSQSGATAVRAQAQSALATSINRTA